MFIAGNHHGFDPRQPQIIGHSSFQDYNCPPDCMVNHNCYSDHFSSSLAQVGSPHEHKNDKNPENTAEKFSYNFRNSRPMMENAQPPSNAIASATPLPTQLYGNSIQSIDTSTITATITALENGHHSVTSDEYYIKGRCASISELSAPVERRKSERTLLGRVLVDNYNNPKVNELKRVPEENRRKRKNHHRLIPRYKTLYLII